MDYSLTTDIHTTLGIISISTVVKISPLITKYTNNDTKVGIKANNIKSLSLYIFSLHATSAQLILH